MLEFENRPPKGTLIQEMNVQRKVKVLPSIKGVDIGFARHCCSVLQTSGKDGLWLGNKTGAFVENAGNRS